MTHTIQLIAKVVAIGVVATLLMDAWLVLLKRLGVSVQSFAMVGRWVGHFSRGVFTHPAIAKAQAVRGEAWIGWSLHYAIGIAFAGLLIAVQGTGWLARPSVLPALFVGVATVIFPLLVLQPAMGAGIASTKTSSPLKNCMRSVANHAVFGMGLYLAAIAVHEVWQ